MDIETENTIQCPVKDLLYLIRQNDLEQLRNALLDVINNSHPSGEIYLYEHGYSFYESKSKHFSPKLVASRGDNKSSIDESDIIQISSEIDSVQFDGFKYLPTEDYVQVFTVESERSSRGLLITINKSVVDEHYIHTLLSAYNHQVHLLRNKDTDSLTGLFNRQSFDSKLNKLHQNFSIIKRSGDIDSHQYCFALLDIDFFKKVNDKYGHVYGDEVLLLFANLMKKSFRDVDSLLRYGGEEFAVLLNDVKLEQAEVILNRFRKTIEEYNFPMDNKVTTSIGHCEFNDQIPLTSIIERADKALYYSKDNGRNASHQFEKLITENKIQDTVIDDGDIELF